MNRLEDYQAFAAIMEKRSLTAAARHLGRSLQAISRSLAAVEKDVGVELIRRTTRSLSPTDAGLAFHRRLSSALAEIDVAKQETAKRRIEATGLLRVAGSAAFSSHYIVPILPDFLAAHPHVEVEIDLSDRPVDLIEEGYDLAIRIGPLADSPFKARQLMKARHVFFAAPSYLARHGRPKHPEDLARHQCIIRTASSSTNAWPFKINGRVKYVEIGGRFRTSGAMAMNVAAVCGLGIGGGPLWQVSSLVDQGELELVLTRFEPAPIPVHALWPATRVLPARTQLFIDFLADRLKQERL
ncbi:MAG TPA: LysR family transcriptional regulator [Terriglobales bacterium]|nr:LysR family transcriptional regulator [Terriglobales bacterium]